MGDRATHSPLPAALPGRRSGARTLILIGALVLAPIVASFIIYYFFPRQATTNYGSLLPTTPAPHVVGTRADGSAFRLDELRGRWVVLSATAADCGPACDKALYATRQARTMQGKDQERIVRVWLAVGDATASAAVLAQHPDLVVARVAPGALDRLPGALGHLYVIDPLGNMVLRYPDDPDIRGLANDLTRLLKASHIG